MRVLLLNDYATPTAGAERLALALRDGLRARGHTVRVLSSRAVLIPGLSFADATCFGATGRLQTLSATANPSAAWALRRELARFRPDVVHVGMYRWQLSPLILPLLRGVPSVYHPMVYKAVCPSGSKLLPDGTDCREPAGWACLRNGCLTPLGFGPLLLQHHLGRMGHGVFSRVVAVSEAVRSRLVQDGLRVDGVLWPGVHEVAARPPLQGPPTLSYAGRLAREKGVDCLLQALASVRERVPEARLLIAGTGPEEKTLRSLVGSLGLGDAVDFLGQLDPPAMERALGQAWAHAVPSQWAEPFGLTAVEAMMRGTAVVTSRAGGLAESVVDGETGFIVPPGDVAALADRLGVLLSDRPLAERMGAAGRARARAHFTTDRYVEAFERLFQSLLPLPAHAA